MLDHRTSQTQLAAHLASSYLSFVRIALVWKMCCSAHPCMWMALSRSCCAPVASRLNGLTSHELTTLARLLDSVVVWEAVGLLHHNEEAMPCRDLHDKVRNIYVKESISAQLNHSEWENPNLIM